MVSPILVTPVGIVVPISSASGHTPVSVIPTPSIITPVIVIVVAVVILIVGIRPKNQGASGRHNHLGKPFGNKQASDENP